MKVRLENHSGNKLSFHWINPDTKEHKLMGHLVPYQKVDYDSTVGHEFQVEEVPTDSSTTCRTNADGNCRVARFTTIDLDRQSKFNFVMSKTIRCRVAVVIDWSF